jgi:hypothetical protein
MQHTSVTGERTEREQTGDFDSPGFGAASAAPPGGRTGRAAYLGGGGAVWRVRPPGVQRGPIGMVVDSYWNSRLISQHRKVQRRAMLHRIKELWCRYTHGRPMHPIHGQYICGQCQRKWPVPWSGNVKPRAASPSGIIELRALIASEGARIRRAESAAGLPRPEIVVGTAGGR